MNPNPFLFWVVALAGVFPLSAFLLVSLGQPMRPFGHLMKASAFWTVVVWVLIAVVMVGVR